MDVPRRPVLVGAGVLLVIGLWYTSVVNVPSAPQTATKEIDSVIQTSLQERWHPSSVDARQGLTEEGDTGNRSDLYGTRWSTDGHTFWAGAYLGPLTDNRPAVSSAKVTVKAPVSDEPPAVAVASLVEETFRMEIDDVSCRGFGLSNSAISNITRCDIASGDPEINGLVWREGGQTIAHISACYSCGNESGDADG
ncbi:MAG: hypothetical protein SVW02_02505 [Candidatus Nanohaloarchaea archaeon]|nr:hypothetical protein [Candidatus Nanohaloarchaea archaeon]